MPGDFFENAAFVPHDVFMLGACLWALVVIRRLWRGAPDGFQRFVLGGLTVSMVGFVVSYVLKLAGVEAIDWAELSLLASLPMQYAVIVNLFRIDEKQREVECRNLRAGSRQ